MSAVHPFLLVLLLLLPAGLASAQLPPPVLKAQVLVKVLRFVEWPAGMLAAGQALQLCLMVDGALAQELTRLAGQDVQGHALAAQPVARGTRWPARCHVALVGGSAPSDAPPGVLVVSEEASALERGAVLTLLVEDGRVVFDVELDAARRSGIGFSARLLRLARFVRRDG